MSYSDPGAALDAVAECLQPMTTRPVHTGLLGTGQTLDCCPEPLLRVESSNTRAANGMITVYGLGKGRCKSLTMDIVVTYQSCFESFDGDTANAATITATTVQGRALLDTWWEALKRVACCSDTNQEIRFTSEQDLAPEGGCAGWTISFEADLEICDCADV